MSRWNYFAAFFSILSSISQAQPLTKVRVEFIETLSPKDTTASERFQRDYERTINLGGSLIKTQLAKCGYELETKTAFYEASDALKAKELATSANAKEAWLVVGPRRSNHYLLLAQGANTTPTVSLMASADSISHLGPKHLSLSPSNSTMAQAAAKEAFRLKGKNATYISITSDDCASCVDFSRVFDEAAARLNLKKLAELKVRGETFDTTRLVLETKTLNPSFILLPNYSSVSSLIMSAHNELPKAPLFIGNDGWGDSQYGFVQNGRPIGRISGFTVRGLPPVEQGLNLFDLGRATLKRQTKGPAFGPSLGILQILDSMTFMLCKDKPKDRFAFSKTFEQYSTTKLAAPWGVSIYELKSGELKFKKTVGIKQ